MSALISAFRPTRPSVLRRRSYQKQKLQIPREQAPVEGFGSSANENAPSTLMLNGGLEPRSERRDVRFDDQDRVSGQIHDTLSHQR